MLADVIHTVGPVARNQVGAAENNDLKSCYRNSLRLVKEHDLRTVVSSALRPPWDRVETGRPGTRGSTLALSHNECPGAGHSTRGSKPIYL